MKIVVVFACLVLSSLVYAQPTWQFKATEVTALNSMPADDHIKYGSDSQQFVDLRLPDGPGPHPVVIIIHGGCWLSKLADAGNTAPLADALRDIGYATWNIEYRGVDVKGGGYPGTFLDVAAAADLLAKNADKYSLDLSRVVVIGHSAGGHLALWLAARDKISKSSPLYLPHPLKLRGVITMGGVPDLKAFLSRENKICSGNVIEQLIGDTKNKMSPHYKDTSPINLLPLKVPQVLLYGAEDQVVPAKLGEQYVLLAKSKGDKVTLYKIPYAAHHEYNVPNSVVWPRILEALKQLISD